MEKGRGCGVKRLNTKSVKFRIIVYTMLCVAAVGFASNLYLYNYLTGIISDKASDIDRMYLDTIQNQLDATLESAHSLGVLCASDFGVSKCMRRQDLSTRAASAARIEAQKILNNFLTSSSIGQYVNKLTAFCPDGMLVSANTGLSGRMDELERLTGSEAYSGRDSAVGLASFALRESVAPYQGKCISAVYPIDTPARDSFLYLELDPRIVTDILAPYAAVNDIFVADAVGGKILASSMRENSAAYAADTGALAEGVSFTVGGSVYRTDRRALYLPAFSVYNCVNVTALELDSRKVTYTILVVLLTSLFVAAGLSVIVSNLITRPIHRLIDRIRKISENDFSFDPEIERPDDEIGQIGRVVNEMTSSIDHLLSETIEIGEQKRNIEIDLLQSQVNPHFLYNTLDSIHWMAVIQKSPGISDMTRSLSNLLKNMAKDFSHKITLEEELRLLDDYVTIQSVRYLETFELVNRIPKEFYACRIVKLTLQPLVENAIFHGIEPSGVCGTITLDAREEGGFLLLTVEDSGVGMTPEELSQAIHGEHRRSKSAMNGIGVANVDKRLRMVYGKGCGLAIESEKGKFTRVTVRILREEGDGGDVSGADRG